MYGLPRGGIVLGTALLNASGNMGSFKDPERAHLSGGETMAWERRYCCKGKLELKERMKRERQPREGMPSAI